MQNIVKMTSSGCIGHGNHTKFTHSYPCESTIHEIFEQVANHYPDNIAVKQGNEILSYCELNSKANALAGLLLSRGVKANDYVAICSSRSIEMVIGLLAILKAGAAYVPIDFSLPSSHINQMIQDASIKICLLSRAPDVTEKSYGLEYIDIRGKISAHDCLKIKGVNTIDSAAYINFSSGTTGKPKGIVCTHRGVIRLLFNQDYLYFSPDIVIFQVAPISFDAATFEIWGSLLHGGKCILSGNEKFINCSDIRKAINYDKVNTMFLTSALFNVLIDTDEDCFKGLSALLFGGDVASIKHVKKLYQANNSIHLINCYGPTENTTFSTYYHIPREIIEIDQLMIPIGSPIGHTEVYILDEAEQPVQEGEIGEICLGGDGLAKGYLNNVELTCKSFVSNYVEGRNRRLYKTGDLGRFNVDGQIEFMGRRDSQVKLNGYRGNVGEIENCINAHFSVKASAVLIREHPSGDKSLVAFIVGFEKNESDLIEYLKERIPDYFIPKRLVWLDGLPITKTGKIDKEKLRDSLRNMDDVSSIFNEGVIGSLEQIEMKLYEMWSNILEVKNIKSTNSFFSLGGSSLGLVKLASLIDDAYNIKIDIIDFYQDPTINYLKRAIESETKNNNALLMQRDAELVLPLSKNQLRFYNQYKLNLAATNMNIIFQLEVEPVNIDQFMGNFHELIINNRIFYCKTRSKNGDFSLHYSPEFKPYIHINNCTELNIAYLDDAVSEEAKYMFNLLEQTPLRVRIWRTNKRFAFVFNIHHLYFDGDSMFCLKNTLRKLATGEKYSTQNIDYLDFCLENSSNNKVDSHLEDRYLNYIGEDRVFALSSFTNKNESSQAEGYQISIDKKCPLIASEDKVLGINKLLLAFQKAIYSMFGVERLICQIPISTNKIGNYAGVLGYFINILIYRNHLNICADTESQLRAIDESIRIAQTFLSINPLDIVGEEDRFDFSSILFNYIPTDEVMGFSDGFFSYEKKFYREMLVFVYENMDHLYLKIVFNTKVFSPDRIHEFSRLFAKQVEELFFIKKQITII